MSELTNTCPACGAEESLDSLLMRMIDDDDVRRLIADVITKSLPLGGLVVRYLRLFKPAKQKLRMTTVHKVLSELVPDIQRAVIERNGRIWAAGTDAWKAALQAVFDAHDKGTLTLPLQGNGYLYQVLTRMADRTEGEQERQVEEDRRHRAAGNPRGEGMAQAFSSDAMSRRDERQGLPVLTNPAPRLESPLVRQIKAQLAANRAAPLEPTE
jgi:hypothetical protein